MKFSVCMDAVFSGMKKTEAIKAIHTAGYDACEFWGWWDSDLEEISGICRFYGIQIVTFCTKGSCLVNKALRGAYIEGLKESIGAAKQCGTSMLITQTGYDTGLSRRYQMEIMAETLAQCVPLLEDSNITLLVEPLNLRIDHPGYFLYSMEDSVSLMKRLPGNRIKILYDIYHQQITEGSLFLNISENLDRIGHFHAAGCPGRAELTSGEIHYRNLLSYIQKAGYQGYVGLEYFPKADAVSGLQEIRGWLP